MEIISAGPYGKVSVFCLCSGKEGTETYTETLKTGTETNSCVCLNFNMRLQTRGSFGKRNLFCILCQKSISLVEMLLSLGLLLPPDWSVAPVERPQQLLPQQLPPKPARDPGHDTTLTICRDDYHLHFTGSPSCTS